MFKVGVGPQKFEDHGFVNFREVVFKHLTKEYDTWMLVLVRSISSWSGVSSWLLISSVKG